MSLSMPRLETTEQTQNFDFYRILNSTANHLLQDSDPDLLCQSVFQTLRTTFNLDIYFHYLVSPDRTYLELASSGGNEVVRAALGTRIDFGQFVCGTVARTCEWMHVTNVQQRTDEMTSLIRSYGIRCYTCQPLISKGVMLGTLSFGSSTRDKFSDVELDLIRVLAQQVTLMTVRRMEQEQVRRLEQLALAGRVSANLAHEINNPLESLGTILYILRDEIRTPEGKGLLHNAEEEVRRLADTTRRTLDLYRGKSPAHYLLDLSALTRDIVDSVTLPMNVQLQTTIADGIYVRAVSGELRQVLLNLLINAAQFTPEDMAVSLTLSQEDGFASVKVRDCGPGISERSRAQIFQPFYTTRSNGGTGIGLWVSREIVERVGGTLTFATTPELDQGTEFHVRIPAVAAA